MNFKFSSKRKYITFWFLVIIFTLNETKGDETGSGNRPETVPGNDETGTVGNCGCKTKLAADIARDHDWPSITFITQQTEFECFPRVAELLTIFDEARSFSVIHFKSNVFGNDTINVLNKRHTFAASFSKKLLSLLMQINKKPRYFSYSSWIIFFQSEDEFRQLRKLSKTLNIFLNSNFFVVDVSKCRENIAQPYSLYRVGERVSDVIVEKGGPWFTKVGFTPPLLNETFLQRRSDFNGYPMEGVGVRVFPHFTTYTKDGELSGFVGDLVTMLKKAHNFSLSYKVLDGYAYGTLKDKGVNKWTGMVGELQEKRVDMTVSELSITKERTEVVSYTQPLYVISRKMYVATKVDTRQKLLTYTTPMELSLLITVFSMMVILVISLALLSHLQQKLFPPYEVKDLISFPVAAWYMISALAQQGSPKCPEEVSTRMVFWYGFLLSLVVYASYSATLVSHLAVVLPVPLPFKDFYGLVQQSNWEAGNVKNDLFEVIASQTCAGDPKEECKILQKVWHEIIMKDEGNLVATYLEGLERVKERNYVFIGVDVTTNNYIKQLPISIACGIRELSTKYITGGIGIGVQHESPFLPIFDESLQNLKEMGIMEKLVSKWLKVKTICANDQMVSADLIDVGSVFMILLMGIAGSAIILGIEYLIYNRDKNKVTRLEDISEQF